MRMRLMILAVLAGCMLASAGCIKYVNIPPMEGDVAETNANDDHVLQVQEEAIRAAAETSGFNSPYTFRTVTGTQERHYLAMAPRLPNATVDDLPNGAKLEVRQVYIRGDRAQVDLVRTPAPGTQPQMPTTDPTLVMPPAPPPSDDPRQLVTVYMRWDAIGGWYDTEVKVWRIPVEQALLVSSRQFATSVEAPPQ